MSPSREQQFLWRSQRVEKLFGFGEKLLRLALPGSKIRTHCSHFLSRRAPEKRTFSVPRRQQSIQSARPLCRLKQMPANVVGASDVPHRAAFILVIVLEQAAVLQQHRIAAIATKHPIKHAMFVALRINQARAVMNLAPNKNPFDKMPNPLQTNRYAVVVGGTPLTGSRSTGTFVARGVMHDKADSISVRRITAAYFDVLRVPVL